MIEEYVFISDKLGNFENKIRNDSIKIIDKIIKENSVIQLGENVEVIQYNKEKKMMKVVTIHLMAINSWGCAGEKLSFYYEGIPLAKKGTPMKKRKPEWFGTFIKDGIKYNCPSYLRLKIIPAKIY